MPQRALFKSFPIVYLVTTLHLYDMTLVVKNYHILGWGGGGGGGGGGL